ncbi:jg15832 [Pararge aegeria aegeria]|uniref:Jg15832 protein n=1 Tax=Pararge aegeria aegeria TaxID=348720 RepID=A0A8S4SG71_9NEOP|nr:jg15832 [Pararge aegeria aegeria]
MSREAEVAMGGAQLGELMDVGLLKCWNASEEPGELRTGKRSVGRHERGGPKISNETLEVLETRGWGPWILERSTKDLLLLLLPLGLSPYLVGRNLPLYVVPLVRLPAGSLQPAELTPEA